MESWRRSVGWCALSTSLAAARRAVCARARACSSRVRALDGCGARLCHAAHTCASSAWQVHAGEAAMDGDEIEGGTVRAVLLARGRPPGRMRSSARVLASRALSMAAVLGSWHASPCILPAQQATSKRRRLDDCQNEECRLPRAGFPPSAPYASIRINKDNYTKYPPSAKLNSREWTRKRRKCCGRYDAHERSAPAIWYYQFTGEDECALGLRSGLVRATQG